MVSFNLRQLFHYLLLIFLVISTLFYLPVSREMPFLQAIEWGMGIQELFFRYGVFFLYAISLFMDPKRNVKPVHFAAFSFYCLISSLFGFDIAVRRAVLNIFEALIFYKMILDHYDSKYIKTFGKFAFGLVLANGILAAAQFYGWDPIFSKPAALGKMDQIAAFMKLKVHLGILAAFLAPYIFNWCPWLVIFTLPLLFFGFSSAAVLAFVISALIVILFRYPRWIVFLAGAAVIAAGFFYIFKLDMPTGQFNERFRIWYETLSYGFRGNPFFGAGLGTFAKWSPITSQVTTTEKLTWIWAHNEYIQLFFEAGIAALLVVIFYFVDSFKKFSIFRRDPELQSLFAGLVSVAVVSFFHFPFHLGRFAPLCIFSMALFHVKYEDLDNAH